jgi:hypothetical protein
MRAFLIAILCLAGAAGARAADGPEAATRTAGAIDLAPLFVQLGLVQPGDRVVRVNGLEPTAPNARAIFRSLGAEEQVRLVIERAGAGEMRLTAALPAAPKPAAANPSEDQELDEMASRLSLTPEQREKVKKIILDGQNEFERKLIAAAKGGVAGPEGIEKIGEEVSTATQKRIDEILFPEQKAKFAEFVKEKRAAELPPPPPPRGAR